MKKCIVFNTIADGFGDFIHFEDIMQALMQNPKLKDTQFIAFIGMNRPYQYSDCVARLDKLGIEYYIESNSAHQTRSQQEHTKEMFENVEQCFVVSYDAIYAYYKPLLPEKTLTKFILEHESLDGKESNVELKRHLGLRAGCKGIKIKAIEHMDSDEIWNTLIINDNDFATKLLEETNSDNFSMFCKNYFVIPIYFHQDKEFNCFLDFIIKNKHLLTEKNIFIYLSGKISQGENLIKIMRFLEKFNRLNERKIVIFSNQSISNESYDALYHLAEMTGVSGDNTFEKAVSYNVLPFYYPNHYGAKQATLSVLREISQTLPIPTSVKRDFLKFFEYTYQPCEGFEDLNFKDLIKYWPRVCDKLREDHNFYDQLDSIYSEGLPKESRLTQGSIFKTPKDTAAIKDCSDDSDDDDSYGCQIS